MAYYQGKLYNKRSKLTAKRQEDEVYVCLRGAHSSFKEGILTVCLELPGRWQLNLEAQPKSSLAFGDHCSLSKLSNYLPSPSGAAPSREVMLTDVVPGGPEARPALPNVGGRP